MCSINISFQVLNTNLLPTGSEEHEVSQTGSIQVAILPSCQSFTIVLQLCIYLGSKNKKHLRGSSQVTIHPLAIILTKAHRAAVSIIA